MNTKNYEQLSIPQSDVRCVLIYAFRYALGRQTYSTSTMQNIINSNWNALSTADRRLIQREIKEHKEQFGSVGDKNIDQPGWDRILSLPVDVTI